VEWLAEQMEILHYDYWAEHISKDEKNQRLKQLKEQAKEMEKDQHIKSWENGLMKVDFNEYYNETYGDDKQ
jgi:hypothetical protein